jgi:predicted nucleic acid-binding protein
MNDRLVVDASVATKWLVPEDDSELADALLASMVQLHAPAFMAMEVANVLWLKLRRGELEEAKARASLAYLRKIPWAAWQGEEPLPATLSLATVLDHAVYDCAYLALALHLDAHYLTADTRFWRKTQSRPELAGRVVRLVDLAERSRVNPAG